MLRCRLYIQNNINKDYNFYVVPQKTNYIEDWEHDIHYEDIK